MPADISSFIHVLKVNTKHQVSKRSCPVKYIRILYALIDSTYVIRFVELIIFMVLNSIGTNDLSIGDNKSNFGIPKNWLYLL